MQPNLQTALKDGNVDVVKEILTDGKTDVNETIGYYTPLHIATENADIAMMDVLITQFNADVNKGFPAVCFLVLIIMIRCAKRVRLATRDGAHRRVRQPSHMRTAHCGSLHSALCSLHALHYHLFFYFLCAFFCGSIILGQKNTINGGSVVSKRKTSNRSGRIIASKRR